MHITCRSLTAQSRAASQLVCAVMIFWRVMFFPGFVVDFAYIAMVRFLHEVPSRYEKHEYLAGNSCPQVPGSCARSRMLSVSIYVQTTLHEFASLGNFAKIWWEGVCTSWSPERRTKESQFLQEVLSHVTSATGAELKWLVFWLCLIWNTMVFHLSIVIHIISPFTSSPSTLPSYSASSLSS